MKKITIQKEISITEDEYKEYLEYYKNMPEKFEIGIGNFIGDKNKIIEEVEKLSDIGKHLLLIHHNFLKWMMENEQNGKKEK